MWLCVLQIYSLRTLKFESYDSEIACHCHPTFQLCTGDLCSNSDCKLTCLPQISAVLIATVFATPSYSPQKQNDYKSHTAPEAIVSHSRTWWGNWVWPLHGHTVTHADVLKVRKNLVRCHFTNFDRLNRELLKIRP